MKTVKAMALATGILVAGSALAAPGDGYWSTNGAKIVDASGNTIHITGVNWFGFETSTLAPHGLWAVNLQRMLDKVKSMGLTVIRLPYSDDIMSNPAVPGVNTDVNADLAGVTTLGLMDKIVAYSGQIGLRIIIDRHRPDSGGQSALWYTSSVSEAKWIADLQALATRYKGNPTVVGFDLHNEPHSDGSGGACWGCGDTARDWRLAAQRAGNAILSVNPDVLIVVEGVSCTGSVCGWWGGNLSQAGTYPVVLSNPKKLVYSAHDYGMSVSSQQSWFLSSSFPATLEPFWDQQWGYLVKQNIAPVLVGEFGSTLADPKDVTWLNLLMKYMQTNGMSWTYWCLNPNSGDTQGLLTYDWVTTDTVRYNVIKPYLTSLAGGGSSSGGSSSSSSSSSSGGSSSGGSTTYALTVTKAGTGAGTVTSSTGGVNCGSTCSATLASGTSVTLTATAATGSTFAGWGGACTGTTCVLSMTAARAVTATFNTSGGGTTYALTVTKAGTGSGTVAGGAISCGSTCSANVTSGTTVTLTATAASGSSFAGWSGSCSGTGTCSVTMTAARAVTATFNTSGGSSSSSSSSGGSSGGGSTPCANPVTFSSQSGNFNTTGAVCLRTAATVNGWGCSNFDGRTVSVNGGTATSTCGAGPFPLPKFADGYTYFAVTGGTYSWASLYSW